jgi:hypothetical protein
MLNSTRKENASTPMAKTTSIKLKADREVPGVGLEHHGAEAREAFGPRGPCRATGLFMVGGGWANPCIFKVVSAQMICANPRARPELRREPFTQTSTNPPEQERELSRQPRGHATAKCGLFFPNCR